MGNKGYGVGCLRLVDVDDFIGMSGEGVIQKFFSY